MTQGRAPRAVVVFLNGAFGVGKTTTARWMCRLDPRFRIVDPEHLGWVLQRIGPLRHTDYQHLRIWRRGIGWQVRALRMLHDGPIVIPMAFDRLEILDEVESVVAQREPNTVRVCLIASFPTVLARLAEREHGNPRERAWVTRRARECVRAHRDPRFGTRIETEGRAPEEVARRILAEVEAQTVRA